MEQIQGMYETLMSICAETPWCFEMDAESGEPMGTFACQKLIQLGCAIQSLDSADEKGGLSMDYLSRLAHPETDARTAIGQMNPEWLKLVSIVQKCKLGISIAAANNVISKDEKSAHNTSYIHKKPGIAIEKRKNRPHRLADQTGGSGKESRTRWKKFVRMASL